MSSFEECLRYFDAGDIAEIRKLLVRWSKSSLGQILVTNIDPLERFLPPEDLREIISALHKNRGLDLVGIADVYEKACWKHVMRGGEILFKPNPTKVGRAIAKSSFIALLADSVLFQGNIRNATRFVNRLLRGDPPSKFESCLPMSKYTAWVTWNEERPDGDPFQFAAGASADFIRASLGLDPRTRREELVLLTYTTESGCALLRPTIADAGVFPFFQPPYKGFEDHGWTKPWLGGMLPSPSLEPRPRPEAIHKPQPIATIIRIVSASK